MRIVIVFLVLAAAVGCRSGGTSGSGKLKVVATTGMIGDACRAVGGGHVEVEVLMGPGVDPHRYLAKPADLTTLAGADVIAYNGLHLEGKMAETLESAKPARGKSFAVTRDIPKADLRPGEDDGHLPDPHVWFDPLLWVTCVETIQSELAAADPAHADDFARNAVEYTKQIRAAHTANVAAIESLPRESRILVTSHDAFGYFGRRYGFTVRGLQGISTAAELGVRERQDLAAFLSTNRVKAVFTETSVPSKGLESVLDATAELSAGRVKVRLVGGDDALYSDALGPPGTPGGTYVGMIRHNVTVIVEALK